MDNLKEIENEVTIKKFNLDEILGFQLENDVQVIRAEDYNYLCYVNKKVYGLGLTPMYALVTGIELYKKQNTKKQ